MPRRRRRQPNITLLAALLILAAALFTLYDAWQDGRLRPGGAPPAWTTAQVPDRSAAPTATPGQVDAVEVFFTRPLEGRSSGGPDERLAAAIGQARETVDMAIYNLSLPNISDALIAARDRGVRVRLVMESEAMDNREPARLRSAGIPIQGDQREGLMHHKFTVIDGQDVWLGSMNYTRTSAYEDYNNLVRIRSQRVAQNFTVEFEEMFTAGLFGPASRPDTPNPQVTAGGVVVETYFSPDDGAAEQIIAEVRTARRSIDFLAYSFTSDPIAEAVIARSREGVRVRGVFDSSQVKSNIGGEYERLREIGLDVRLDAIPGLMHNKVIVIDGETVITGSYNFSRSAEESNDEHLVILHDPVLAAQYLAEFEGIYQSE